MDNNISKAFIWNTLGSGVYLGCLWLLNILVVRFGSYSEAGILSLAISIANVVQSVSLAGIRNYQVSDVKERYSNYTYICVRYITASIAFAGCIFFLLINAYSRYQVLCIIGMSVYRMIDALTDVYHGILQKKWRLDIVGKALAIRGVLIVSVFITILSIGKDLLLAIIGMTVVSFAEFIVFELRKTKKVDSIIRKVNKNDIISLLIYSIPLTIYSTLLNAITVVTRYYIEAICGEELLGYYASISSPAIIVQVAATYIFTPLVGVFAELYRTRDKRNFDKLIIKCLGLVSVIIVCALICCQYLGDWGLQLLFGKEILKHSYLLQPIVISTALMAVILFLSMLLIVVRNMIILVFGNLVGFLINVIFAPALIRKYNMQGANYILIISLLIDMIILSIGLRYSEKRTMKSEK